MTDFQGLKNSLETEAAKAVHAAQAHSRAVNVNFVIADELLFGSGAGTGKFIQQSYLELKIDRD